MLSVASILSLQKQPYGFWSGERWSSEADIKKPVGKACFGTDFEPSTVTNAVLYGQEVETELLGLIVVKGQCGLPDFAVIDELIDSALKVKARACALGFLS